MAKGTREIRRKIKSIKNTKQITKAMELVAASKMRKAVANTLALRPYARLAQTLLMNLATLQGAGAPAGTETGLKDGSLHPLLEKREVHRVLVIVLSTDKGLCGGLNTQLFRKLHEYIKTEEKKALPPALEFVAVGRKVQDFLRRLNQKVIAAYGAMSNNISLKETYPISRMVLDEYSKARYDKVMLIYTDFISAVNQKPTLRRLLPFSHDALEEMIDGLGKDHQSDADTAREYVFEPSPEAVLTMLLPRLTEMQIYQAVLEATASEHSARMFAMRNASDNASELIDDFTLAYNQIRQGAITQELAEISAGRAALG